MTLRRLGLGCAAIVAVAAGLIAVIFVGSYVNYRLELFGFFPEVSETEARQLVAEFLCPQAPERMLPRLTAAEDSGVRFVYADAVVEDGKILDSRAKFTVGKDEGRAFVDLPRGEIAKTYLEEARAACAAGKAPP